MEKIDIKPIIINPAQTRESVNKDIFSVKQTGFETVNLNSVKLNPAPSIENTMIRKDTLKVEQNTREKVNLNNVKLNPAPSIENGMIKRDVYPTSKN